MQLRSRLSSVVLGLLIGAGCGGAARQLRALDEEQAVALRSVDLPTVAGAPTPAPPGAVRLLVRPGSVAVDDLQLWRALSPEQLSALLEGADKANPPWTRSRVLALEGLRLPDSALRRPGGYLITALFDALSGTMERFKILRSATTPPPEVLHVDSAAPRSPPPGRPAVLRRPVALLYADARASFSLMARVLYTLGQAEYSHFVAVASAAEGGGEIPVVIDVPRIGAAPDCDPNAAGAEVRCAEVQLELSSAGVEVETRERSEGPCSGARAKLQAPIDPGRLDSLRAVFEAGSSHGGSLSELLSGAGLRPSPASAGAAAAAAGRDSVPERPATQDEAPATVVPWNHGALDAPALVRALSTARGDLPLCRTGTVGPAPDQSWERTVQAVAALRAAGAKVVYLFVNE